MGDKSNITDYTDVLQKNKNLNFVKRLFDPNAPAIKNLDGSYSTHKMMSTVIDGKPVVLPTIIQDPISGLLTELNPRAAIVHAFQNKEFIQFDTPGQAEDFANNGYKRSLGARFKK